MDTRTDYLKNVFTSITSQHTGAGRELLQHSAGDSAMAIEDTNLAPHATELDVFLPKDGSDLKDSINNGKYEVTIIPKDVDTGYINRDGKDIYDPFRERKVEHPTTDCDTVTHLLKASLGSGILAMPVAFKHVGLTMGVLGTVLIAIVCTHCSYILVKCAHKLYYRTRINAMTFADVGEVSFANGPSWSQPFAKTARLTILMSLFATYFGTCSVYTVIVASNFKQVIEYYAGVNIDSRAYIAILLIPLILLAWVPNLKYLAPVSMMANAFMAVGLGITIYYLVIDLPHPSTRTQFASVSGLPQFVSLVIFAMEAIGVVMPLENNMKFPRHFLGICGVLNQGMTGVTFVYILLGFLGYLRFGDDTDSVITLNLDSKAIPAQIVKILISLAVFCTYGLQFFVCLEIAWNGMKDRFRKKPLLAEYGIRTTLVTLTILLAVAVPTIEPFIGLIGSLCFSLLGLIIPAFIEVITYWEDGFGFGYYRIWKNILLTIFGVLCLIFGSYTSVRSIVKLYQ